MPDTNTSPPTEPPSTQPPVIPEHGGSNATRWIRILLLITGVVALALIATIIYALTTNPTPLTQNQEQSTITITPINTPINTPTPIPSNGQLVGKLAFIRDGNVWFSDNGVEKQLTTDIGLEKINDYFPQVSYPQLSPNGQKVAYLRYMDDDLTRTLFVSDVDGSNVKQLAEDVKYSLSLMQWSNDGRLLYYPQKSQIPPGEMLKHNMIISVDVNTGQKQEHGRYSNGDGCGFVTGPGPAALLSYHENEGYLQGVNHLFKLSPNNDFIIHNNVCSISGLSLLNLETKEGIAFAGGSSVATISPDQKLIASTVSGVIAKEHEVVIFDVAGTLLKKYQTSERPQGLLWDAAGETIYYSSSEYKDSLGFDNQSPLSSFYQGYFMINSATLWKIPLDGPTEGISEKIITLDAHYMRPIFMDENKVLVVIVENPTRLYDHVNEQRTEESSKDIEYQPTVKLVEINLADLTAIVVADRVEQASYYPN